MERMKQSLVAAVSIFMRNDSFNKIFYYYYFNIVFIETFVGGEVQYVILIKIVSW